MRISLVLVLYAFVTSAWAATGDAYVTELQTQARTQQLQSAPEWLALLHYRAGFGGSYTSEALTAEFFLAPHGRSDPAAELDATLASFFHPPPDGAPDHSTQCRFIARYQWLKVRLHFDPVRLPEQPCPAFETWYQAIDPGSVVLVFPTAYLDNPSSIFGHTLLRFDHPQQPEQTHLESYSVNFAARTDDSGIAGFIFKGLTGGYPGVFSLEPYFRKVKEYSDIEERDIWEYELAYTPAETRRMLEHLWELQDVSFPYYFFSRNCSYAILELLDVARPDSALATRFVYQVIPGDTVKAVLAQPAIVLRRVYRPSLAARIHSRLAHMPDSDQRLALEISRGIRGPGDPEIMALPTARQADIYDTALDYLLYLGNRGDASTTMPAIEQARARLDAAPADAVLPPDTDPADSHGSTRLSLGLGRLGGSDYQQLEWRGAYHDLLDPAPGFAPGMQIGILDLGIRHGEDGYGTRLEYLDLAEALSLASRDVFFRPLSWNFSAGWDRRWIGPGRRPLVGDILGGAGLSYRFGDDALLYALAGGTLLTGGGIPGGYALGAGPDLGLSWRVSPRWNLLLDLQVQRFPDRLHDTAVDYSLQQEFVLGQDWAFRLCWSRQGVAGALQDEASLRLMWYF